MILIGMKKLLTSLLLAAGMVLTLAAADAVLTWTPNPSHELVSGYRIEYMKLPSVTNWTYITFSQTNGATVKNLQPGYIYMFRAFAVNGIGVGTNSSDIVQLPTNAPSAVLDFKQK